MTATSPRSSAASFRAAAPGLQIILASASPRRRELLEQTGLGCQVIPAEIDESRLPREAPAAYVTRLAAAKAEQVLAKTGTWTDREAEEATGLAEKETFSRRQPLLLVAADTVIEFRGNIYGKPGSREAAAAMLRRFSGKKHQVLTGMMLVDCQSGRTTLSLTRTGVWFRKLDEQEILSYVSQDAVLHCAGAYRIQEKGALLVRRIKGSYSNVVGLPLETFQRELGKLGYSLLTLLLPTEAAAPNISV